MGGLLFLVGVIIMLANTVIMVLTDYKYEIPILNKIGFIILFIGILLFFFE